MRRPPAHALRIDGHRRQRRHGGLCLDHVVEADHAEVAARLHAGRAQPVADAEGGRVVEAERSGRPVGNEKRPLDGGDAPGARGRGTDDERIRRLQPGFGQGIAPAGDAFTEDRGVGYPAEEGDAAVAERNEVAHRILRAGMVVGGKAGDLGADDVAHHGDDGNAARGKRLQVRRLGAAGGREDEAGNAVLAHRGDDLALAVDAFGGVRQELHVAGRLHDHVHADGKLGEEGVGEVVDDDADDPRGRRLAQVRRAAVVDIAELADDRVHLRPRRLVDERACLQDERDGRLRHAGGARNIDDGHPALVHGRSSLGGAWFSRLLVES